MPRTPDRTPGPAQEEELQLEDRTPDGDPTVNGAIRYVSNDIVAKLPSGVVSLTAGTGLSESSHQVIDDPIHNIAEDCEGVVTRDGNSLLSTQTIRDQSDTPLIRKFEYTRTSGRISQITVRQYDGSGTEKITVVIDISRDSNGRYSGFVMNRTDA